MSTIRVVQTRLAGLWGFAYVCLPGPSSLALLGDQAATSSALSEERRRGDRLTGPAQEKSSGGTCGTFCLPLLLFRMSFPGGWEGGTRSVWRRLRLEQAKRSHRLPTLTTHTQASHDSRTARSLQKTAPLPHMASPWAFGPCGFPKHLAIDQRQARYRGAVVAQGSIRDQSGPCPRIDGGWWMPLLTQWRVYVVCVCISLSTCVCVRAGM